MSKIPTENTFMELAETIAKRYPVQAIYLFGSMATGKITSHSDIDIAVLFDKAPSSMDRLNLQEQLTDIAGRDVDLVVLNTVSPILAMQVIRKGKKLLVPDKKALDIFIMKTVSMYHDLKITRRAIEANILVRPILD